jgi:uncharacterized protein YecT (DUF1311 family)
MIVSSASRSWCLKASLAFVVTSFLTLSPTWASASATTQTTTPVTYDSSCQQTALTQVAMGECAVSELKQVQRQLTTLLNEESAGFGKKAVDRVEGQWRQYRDSECALEARPNKGGTIVGLVITNCEVQLTVQRAQSLMAYLQSRPH